MSPRVVVVVLSLLASGCITRAGGGLAPIEVEPAGPPVSIEQTVGDFAFTLEGGKLVSSQRIGRLLNQQMLGRWKKQGLIADESFVESSRFSGKADYNLTLGGRQFGDSNVALQVLSGLTLFLIPYTVDTRMDLRFTLEDVKTGVKYDAAVSDSYRTTVELFLMFAAPVATRGQQKTINAMADHLYHQLQQAGAFSGRGSVPATP